MPLRKRQLAEAVRAAAGLPDRDRFAAFVLDDATDFTPNPFARTRAGALRQIWGGQAFEFRLLNVHAAGLDALLATVAALPPDEALTQEILRAGPHTLYVFRAEAGGGVVGAVLYGKAGVPLPEHRAAPPRPARRRRVAAAQLDLFADA